MELLLELQLKEIIVAAEIDINEAMKEASETFFMGKQHNFIAMHLYEVANYLQIVQ